MNTPNVSIAYDVRPNYDHVKGEVVHTNHGIKVATIKASIVGPLMLNGLLVGALAVDELIYENHFWSGKNARLTLSLDGLRVAMPAIASHIDGLDMRFIPLRWLIQLPHADHVPAGWQSMELEVMLTEWTRNGGIVHDAPCKFTAKRVA